MTLLDRRAALRYAAVLAAAPAGLVFAQEPKAKADPYSDGKLISGEPPMPAAGSFTIAVLPDTQYYSEKYPATFLAQTEYIVANRKSRNIACVLHLGDFTNRNTVAEWENAAKALAVLDEAQFPYFFCPGNHDYSDGGLCTDRTTRLNDFFPLKNYRDLPTFGGTYDREPDRMENSYHMFAVGGREFLVLALEFGPRADVIRWANDVVSKYPKREAILVTHAFTYSDDTRHDWKKYGPKQRWNPHAYGFAKVTNDDVADGEELWAKLVSRHENFILTINGHVLHDGLGRLTTKAVGGRAVPQVLVNFQMRPKGGDGWLRLLEFKADRSTVEVYDYSPTRKQRNEGAGNRFTLTLAPVGTS